MEKRFLNVNEVSEYLGISPNTVRSWQRLGKLPFSKLGRAVRFDLKKINTWLKDKEYRCIKRKFSSTNCV